MVPTWRLAVVAAVWAVVSAVPGSWWWWAVANAALLVVAVADVLAAPRRGDVVVARRLPAALALGGQGELAWRATNRRGRPVHVRWADDLAPSLHADRRRVVATIPPGATVESTTGLRPERRGRFRPSRIVLRAEGPLRLMARQWNDVVPGELRVLPPFRSKDEAELRIARARLLEIGLRSAQGRGGGTEFDQLRDYTADDEFRRIDWSATARTGRPIVRSYRAERNQTVVVLMDNGRLMAGRVGGVARVEHAMDAVLMLTAVASRLGDRTGLVVFDRAVRSVVAPGAGHDQLRRVTDALYALEPELAESDYRGAFAEAVARFRRRSLFVVLTELTTSVVEEALLPALPVLGRHHLAVIGAVRDPDVEAWARDPAGDADASYRKAAAVAALDQRALAVARLQRAGATVIDALPGALAPRLADAYLRVKATGRL